MSLLRKKTVVVKCHTILVPLESYLYLQDKEYFERCGKHHSEKHNERLIRNFKRFSNEGKYKLKDRDLGGCIGKPENAWEEGRWTSWSCEDMIQILNEACLPYEQGEDSEYIAV